VSSIVTCRLCVTSPGPAGQHVQPRVMRSGRVYKAEFVGHTVGAYNVELAYGGMAVPGSPFTCNLYDVSKVKLTETAVSASVGQPVTFAGESVAFSRVANSSVRCTETAISSPVLQSL